MIKFVIGLIALIFVVLSAYIYTGKKGKEVTKSVVTHNVFNEKAIKQETGEMAKISKDIKLKASIDSIEEDLLVKKSSDNKEKVIEKKEVYDFALEDHMKHINHHMTDAEQVQVNSHSKSSLIDEALMQMIDTN